MKNILLLLLLGLSIPLFSQQTYVPDDNFEQALIDLGYDDVLDDYVLTSNISGVTSLNIENSGISDLTGIEDFTALLSLLCDDNNLDVLDLSQNVNLTELNCSNNLLHTLNVTQCTNLYELDFDHNELVTIDLSQNAALNYFDCSYNLMTSLDLSSNSSLEYVLAMNNALTELDIRNGNNENIAWFYANNNPDLTCIYVDDKDAGYLSSWVIDAASNFVETEVECDLLQTTYVPDDNFEQALIDLGYDDVLDDYVLTANISGIIDINLAMKDISDLTGIEDFSALEELICAQNLLTDLDVSQNTSLTFLLCDLNMISELNLSQNTLLEYLDCSENMITSLDLSVNTNLTTIACENNQLAFLDVRNGNNENITGFSADINSDLYCIYVDDKDAAYLSGWITDPWAEFVESEAECIDLFYTYVPDDNFEQALIDLGYDDVLDDYVLTANISAITALDVYNENISDLTGIEDFVSIIDLDCQVNSLSSIDLSENIQLSSLNCSNNSLTELDVSNNTALTNLSCYDNELTSLDLSLNTNLQYLYCKNNQITSLNINDISNLTEIDCSHNEITSLNTSLHINLTSLLCYNNNIANIDISQNTLLIDLLCGSNNLSSIDVSNNNVLEDLWINSNQFTAIDVSQNSSLIEFVCDYNSITNLDLSNNPNLSFVICLGNELTEFDIRNGNNQNIQNFNSQNNPNLKCIYVDDKDAAYLDDWVIDPASTFVETETECDALDISLISEKQDLSIYPNPVKEEFHILSKSKIHNVLIYDMTGKCVKSFKDKAAYSIHGLQSGVYFVEIQTNEKTYSAKLFIQ